MEDSASMLKQLRIIKWLVALITASILTAAGSVAYFSYLFFDMAENSITNDTWEDENFRDKVSALVDQNKLDEAVMLSSARNQNASKRRRRLLVSRGFILPARKMATSGSGFQ